MNVSESQSESSGQALPAGTRLEEFVIERVLGSGGFGITYLARDMRLDRRVVIKENLPVQFCFRDTHSLTVAPRHSHAEDMENFRWSLENFTREAALLASVDHPGIVKVLRSFEAFGTAYFVMPFVEGTDLGSLIDHRLAKNQLFAENELRGLLERTLNALTHLHDRGIYHRDIKPANILISNEGVPTLIDFGSARQRLSERSMTVIESPGYTPFEQLQTRGNVGPWSDLYALGGTLCKAITGEAPPKAMDRMRRDPFLPLASRSELRGHYPVEFLRGIDKALAVEEGDRWQNADEWQSGLRQGSAETRVVRESAPSAPTHPLPKGHASATKKVMDRSTGLLGLSNKALNRVGWAISACLAGVFIVLSSIESSRSSAEEQQAWKADQERNVEATAKSQAAAAAKQAQEAWEERLRAERDAMVKPSPSVPVPLPAPVPPPAPVPADPVPAPPTARAAPSDVVGVMKQHIQGGNIKEFEFKQVQGWRAGPDEVIDGESFQVGLIRYMAETIFGTKSIEAKALIKNGEVVMWIWPKSGMEIK